MASQAEIDLVVNASNTLRDLQRDLDRVTAAAQAGADPVSVQARIDAQRSLITMSRELDRITRAVQATADPVRVRVDVDSDDASQRLRGLVPDMDRLTGAATGAVGAVGRLGVGIAGAGAAGGAAVPLIAGVVAAVEAIAPAAAVATTGMLAVKLAAGTLQLGMLNVGEAIETAFDPEAKPEDLAKAIAKLAPEAAAFVTELTSMRGAFKDLQLDVQNRLFTDFDDALRDLSTAALPDVEAALDRTADSLNAMALGAAAAATVLAEDGTLGKALAGATAGIQNLEKVPGQAVTAFGQLAAAAAPAFDRVTEAVARVATTVSEKLNTAFESGALEDAINGAIDVLAQLGRIAGNVFGTLGNLLQGVSTEGEGLFGTLERVTQALEAASATPEFQEMLSQLVQTMSLLAKTAVPLFVTALGTVGEVITVLAPFARELIEVLGAALGDALDASREPLVALAGLFGEVVEALLPFVELAGELIAAILPVLTPFFEELGKIVAEMAPFFKQLAENIGVQLLPILERLPEVVGPIMEAFTELAGVIFPLLTEILAEISPSLETAAAALGDMLVELTPLIVELIKFVGVMAEDLLPIVGPVLVGAIIILTSAIEAFADIIGRFVVPAVKGIAALLSGDGSKAFDFFADAASGAADLIKGILVRLLGDTGRNMVNFVEKIQDAAVRAWDAFKQRAGEGVTSVIGYIRDLPGRILDAVNGFATLLRNAGINLMVGFINGIVSMIPDLIRTLGNITNRLPDWKGPAERDATILVKSGQLVMDGLIDGFESRIPDIRASLGDITAIIPQSVAGGSLSRTPGTPTVFVTIGNEAVDQFVTTRVEMAQRERTRVMAQGVRR